MDRRKMCYKMIKDSVETIKNSDAVTLEEAFEKLLNYCAVNLYLNSECGVRFKTDTLITLDKCFDFNLLKEVKEDVLGSVYYDLFKIKKPKASNLKSIYDNFAGPFPETVLATNIGTATGLIGKAKDVLVYTVTEDLITYRISLVNRALHDLSLFSLFVDSKRKKKVNLELTCSNWEFANRWVPVKSNHLV